jgi:Mrp family chromosome partitioning ATPase
MREPTVPDAGEGTGQSDNPKRKLALPMVMRLVWRHQRMPKHGREAGSDALVVVTRRKSLVAEAYRTLRTAMLLSSADRPPQVMQITSAQSREGKTVTTVNTAATLAQSGAKVLVIDADLRRPRCHRVLMTEIAPGLVDCLVGHSSFEACVRSIRYQPSANGASGNGSHDNSGALFDGCLDLMTAGTRPPNPAEILGSERMGEMLTMVRQRYDYILIDTPPVLPVADAVLLSRLVDGVLVVVNGTITPRGLVREAIKRLRRVKAPIMGVALNEVDVVKGDYHYYYRTYYSSYEYVDTRNA